jgi:hypothetical protein
MLGPKLLLGGELSSTLLLSSQRAFPTALLRSGFEFEHQTLDVALRHVLQRP